MRNTRQGLLGFEESDAPTLQQLMVAMRALQEANEKYQREEERVQEEDKAELEQVRVEALAEKELLQDRPMA